MNVSQVLPCKNIDEIKRFFRSQLYVCLPQLYVFSFWSQRLAYAPLWFPHNNHLVGFQQTSRFAFKISQIKMVRLPVEWTSALIQSTGRSKTLYKTCHIHIRGSVSSIYDVQQEEPSDYYMTRSTSWASAASENQNHLVLVSKNISWNVCRTLQKPPCFDATNTGWNVSRCPQKYPVVWLELYWPSCWL